MSLFSTPLPFKYVVCDRYLDVVTGLWVRSLFYLWLHRQIGHGPKPPTPPPAASREGGGWRMKAHVIPNDQEPQVRAVGLTNLILFYLDKDSNNNNNHTKRDDNNINNNINNSNNNNIISSSNSIASFNVSDPVITLTS